MTTTTSAVVKYAPILRVLAATESDGGWMYVSEIRARAPVGWGPASPLRYLASIGLVARRWELRAGVRPIRRAYRITDLGRASQGEGAEPGWLVGVWIHERYAEALGLDVDVIDHVAIHGLTISDTAPLEGESWHREVTFRVTAGSGEEAERLTLDRMASRGIVVYLTRHSPRQSS